MSEVTGDPLISRVDHPAKIYPSLVGSLKPAYFSPNVTFIEFVPSPLSSVPPSSTKFTSIDLPVRLNVTDLSPVTFSIVSISSLLSAPSYDHFSKLYAPSPEYPGTVTEYLR